MPNPMESLQTLLRLRSPQRVETGDPWMARRQSEIASGLDDVLPDADSPEYKYDQIEQGSRYGVSLPRADARSSDMSKLRQVLSLKQRAHEQDLEKANLKGQYDVAGQVAGQQAAMDRLLTTQGAITNRSERGYVERDQLEDQRQQEMAERAASGAADRLELEKFRQGEMTKRAGQGGGGMFSKLWSLLGYGDEAENAEPEAAPATQPTGRRGRIVSVR